ncbi:MAG: GPR endopeptidase [Bacilli bacterium]|nr:GPR endopeptidase [Bacilli bacterium]
MGKSTDLSMYNVRTDLAIELVNDEVDTKVVNGVKVTSIVLSDDDAKRILKKSGSYVTIEFDDITDYDKGEKIKTVFEDELKKFLKAAQISDEATCLVIGLGNAKVTPDAIGPLTLEKTIVTNHLYVYGELDEGFRRVSAIRPGVMGETGIETGDLLKGIVDKIKPDFIITVDALAASSIERVNRTIQMTNAGINPGSGVGNKRKEISFDTLGVPVIAIGVPTVVDAASIVNDTIHYMYKNYAYTKETINKPSSKVMMKVNYLKRDVEVKEDDKKSLFGILGSLNDEEVRGLIYEVLNPVGYNLMVTPKEEDYVVEKISDVISGGINSALHKKVD